MVILYFEEQSKLLIQETSAMNFVVLVKCFQSVTTRVKFATDLSDSVSIQVGPLSPFLFINEMKPPNKTIRNFCILMIFCREN